MPRVSIITAVHNQASYVKKMVQSVLEQTFTDYEHIVIDDGSTDDTATVLAPYMHKIRYEHQENQGNVASRNRGLEKANGELLAVLDGDDYWAPLKLEQQVDIMNRDPVVGLVYTGLCRVDSQDNVISVIKATDISDDPLRHQLSGNAVPFSSILIRRNVLENGVLVDPRLNLVGDWFLTLQIALQGKRFACLPQELLFLRRHSASMSNSLEYVQNYLTQTQLVIDEIENDPRLPEGHTESLKRARARNLFAAGWFVIDRGTSNQRCAAHQLLVEALLQDSSLLIPVTKQFIKSFLFFGKSKAD